MDVLAVLTIISGIASLICLLVLHVVNPEFKPGWRMVSEYALGKHTWILTLFFLSWSICSLLSACLLWNIVTSSWAMFGTILVFVAGIGAFMGGLFDVKHKLHGLSFALGVPTLPIGALLISYNLVTQEGWNDHRASVLLSAHAAWISLVLMAITMGLLISGFKKAGVAIGPNAEPQETLPDGVIGLNGYANRILVASYIIWSVLMAVTYLSL